MFFKQGISIELLGYVQIDEISKTVFQKFCFFPYIKY